MKKRLILLLTLMLLAGVTLVLQPRGDIGTVLSADAERNGAALKKLIQQYQGSYVDSEHEAFRPFERLLRWKLIAADLRDPACSRLCFSYLPETSVQLLYCPEDEYTVAQGRSVTTDSGEVLIGEVGSLGRGYILCRRICKGWFYLETCVPT